jgi:hypothetical protein
MEKRLLTVEEIAEMKQRGFDPASIGKWSDDCGNAS